MKDSFQAADEIRKIYFSLLNKGYSLVSFDVVSLFTNVPLNRTINVILKRIYTEKLVNVKLRKSTLKKLIHDSCTKTTFSFNDQLYEQIDGVCMGSSLGPTIANIIMTELEREILPQLIETGTIKSYIRYVDDTLVMIKDEDIEKVLTKFNSLDKNLKFTVDKFEDGVIHFLDILVDKNGSTDIYTKPTNTGQYTNFDSYVPWRYKTSWAYALYVRTMKLCSSAAAKSKQITRINKLLSWNGFPKYVRSKLISKFKTDYASNLTKAKVDDEIECISLKIPYLGAEGEKLVKTLRRKFFKNISRKLKLRIVYSTTKLSDFCGVKDKLPEEQKNNVIYSIKCPACESSYIGKTDCCFGVRMHEHGTKPEQPMYEHLTKCEAFNYITNLHALPDIVNDDVNINRKAHLYETVINSSKVLKTSRDWLQLCYLESYMIKKHKPMINIGIRAAKDLQLF